jgi:type VI secretion system secreted protein VgrG
MAPTGYALTDYNFEIPSTDLFHKTGGGSPALVVYEHPGNYEKKAQGEAMTKLRLEAHEGGQKVLRGNSNCRGFSAGGKFKLKEHGRADFNKEYVFRMVSHTADRSSYGNHFEALPADVVFRPPLRARRPMALGSQSAMVVGKSGEEIWTDKFGRVKVHFPWDRKGKKDENSSCWVRVAQHWAGKQYGQFFLPRIGQEVVISFIDGNPDRPLITGAVYNGEQTVPYELPANQTKSTTKTRTSKGGGGFNEIRFEDKKDKEEVFIHAAKDMNVDVKHDRTTKVGNDDSLHVKKNRTKKVDENEETTIKKNRTVEISEGDESLTVKKGKRTILVDKGDETHTVKGKRTLTVHKDEAHTSKAKFDHTVKGNYTLKIGGDLTILVDGDIKVKSKKSISYEAGTEFKLKAGTDVAMKSGTDFKLEAGTNFAQKAAIGFKLAAVTLEAKASAMGEVSSGGIMSLKGALTKIG